jgi:uncharacterized protein involved in copper resistance
LQRIFGGAIVLLAAAWLAGCRSETQTAPPPAEEHAHADTYSEAVELLDTAGAKIRDAFTSGDPEAGHGALHSVAHALESIEGLAEKAELPEADRAEVSAATDKLLDAYMKLDGSLHGGAEVAYDDVSEAIDSGLAVLKSKVDAAAADLDHGDHD